MNSARQTENFKSDSGKEAHEQLSDSELAIDINSDIQNCDNSDADEWNSNFPSEHKLESDAEKLIRAAKKFCKDCENNNNENQFGYLLDDQPRITRTPKCSNALLSQSPPVFETNEQQHHEHTEQLVNFYFDIYLSKLQNKNVGCATSSQRNNTFIPKIQKVGPYGTGIIRQTPRKHSCVQKIELTSIKRSYRSSRNIRPYSVKYYNFERTHPNLRLIENGETIIPKRVLKQTPISSENRTVNKRPPLLKNGTTWHELFDRGSVYSAKSLQHISTSSSAIPVRAKCTQTSISESFVSKFNGNLKFEKHVLPQLNIRAECIIQKIPELSIAPDEIKRHVKPNIKLVEIIYGESSETVPEAKEAAVISKAKEATVISNTSPKHDKSTSKEQEISQEKSSLRPSLPLQSQINDNNSNATHSTMPSTTSLSTLSNSECNGSLEQSISLNVSRIPPTKDHDARRHVPNKPTCAQSQRKRFVKHRRDTIEQNAIKSSSDPSEFEFDRPEGDSDLNAMLNVQLPTFPTKQLMQLVDAIFDTSSDGDNNRMNATCLQMVKETSVQTDIVWENVNEYLRQQSKTIDEFVELSENPAGTFVLNQIHTCDADDLIRNESDKIEATKNYDRHYNTTLVGEALPERTLQNENRPRTLFKKCKICFCLGCQNNPQFSVTNKQKSLQEVKSSESSSAAIVKSIDRSKTKLPIRTNLLPSERYKQMKQAQRNHFESDPRVAKTLDKIYKTAKFFQSPSITTSSSSSHGKHFNAPQRASNFSQFSLVESLQPDLYTFNDELLLFGSDSTTDECFEYSSRLLKTESSQDTLTSNERFFEITMNKDAIVRNRYTCTNSEDSNCHSLEAKPVSDLEQCLLNDIENSWSDPAMLNSVYSTSSLERKINEIQINK